MMTMKNLAWILAVLATLTASYADNDATNQIVGDHASSCVDQDEKCPGWASAGECQNNPAYMLTYCRRSCNNCFGEATNAMNMHQQQQQQQQQAAESRRKGEDLGVAQILSAEDGTREADIQWILRKARNYMTTVVPSKFDVGMNEICQNKHAKCAYLALTGECIRSAEFMDKVCAPVCQRCEALTIEGRCPIDPDAPQAWGPGDLNKMFERLTSEPYKSKYSVEILSSPSENDDDDGPWIITMDDVITEMEAQRLIELGHERGYERSQDVGRAKADGTHEKYVNDGRTSTNAWCNEECMDDPYAISVMDRLTEITGIPKLNSEHLQLLKYEVGQSYVIHHDYVAHHITKQGGVRILTVFLYLNDVAAGGGTNFDQYDITVTPKRGRVLLWPSVLDDTPDIKDDRTTHQALPVENGIKFAANAWFHMRDFQTPLAMGCMG